MTTVLFGGGQGGELGSNGDGKSAGGRRGEGGRRDTQGGRSREKQEVSCTTLHNFLQQLTQRRKPLKKGAGTRRTSYGKWEVQTPLSPPPPLLCEMQKWNQVIYRGYYMPACGYEFYLRLFNSISHECMQ